MDGTTAIHPPETTTMLDEAPVRLCCGKRHYGVVCPDGMVMCQLCYDRFPKDKLFRDEEGYYHDICVECQIG